MLSLYDQIQETAQFLKAKVDRKPRVGVICGTGMGALAEQPEGLVKVPYQEIPHFPVATVESHPGNLCFGTLEGVEVVVMQGRFHRYEGWTMQQVTYPVRVMKALGVDTLIVMNAVGSVNPLIPTGSLVLVTDHINLMGDNPLIGPNDERLGVRFPDMSEPYNRALIAVGERVALEKRIRVHRGVLVSVTGPNLETAAEYRMFQRIGADMVTMSTIPEVIVAVHSGVRVVALSTVTDACLPDALKPADLHEIIAVANSREADRCALVRGLIAEIGMGA
ncbi:MAG: purine-nucleoside phosphorylase [Candidatus Sumerlaeia bacterium]|nr:purine-nucleoside phosphorylase [Candidatus Sumerlaeia bacterium]